MDDGRGSSSGTKVRRVLAIASVIVFLLTPVFIYIVLERSGTLGVTFQSNREEPVHYRLFVEGTLVAEDTMATRGGFTHTSREGWWLTECTTRSVRAELSSAADTWNRTAIGWLCDGRETWVELES